MALFTVVKPIPQHTVVAPTPLPTETAPANISGYLGGLALLTVFIWPITVGFTVAAIQLTANTNWFRHRESDNPTVS